MIDSTTSKPLYVSKDGDSGPYIIVPLEQVGAVSTVLEEAISIDGKPAITVVNLGRDVDQETASKALDEAS